MKRSDDHKYSNIESFEDFRYEREKLVFRRKLIESKLYIAYIDIKRLFSLTNLIFSAAGKFVLPKLSDLLEVLLGKINSKESPEKGDNGE